MKTFFGVVALATIIASPAFAQRTTPGSADPVVSNVVIVDGMYVGQDPDPNVRLDLRRSVGAQDN